MKYLKFWIKVITLLILWGFLLPQLIHAQPGAPDLAFGGGDGYSTTHFLMDGHASADAVAIQPNGRIVVAGDTWIPQSGGSSFVALARYMPNGVLDQTFGNNGKVQHKPANLSVSATDVVILPDGKILCAGQAWNVNGTDEYFLLARFNADGTPDLSFDGDGIVTTQVSNFAQYGSSIALQADGKIIVGGSANISGYDEWVVLRYKPNGTLDNTFGGGDGYVSTPLGESYAGLSDIAIQADGKIVGAGYAVKNGVEDFAVVRFKTNGSLDLSFGGGDGVAMVSFTNYDDNAYSLALQPDGKLVLAGTAGYNIGVDSDIAIARFTKDGILDNSFDGDGLATVHATLGPEGAREVIVQPDGKILLGGYSRNDGQNEASYHFTLARVTPNGSPDPGFGQGDGVATLPLSPSGDFLLAMALQPNGKVVAVGNAVFDYYQRFAVASFLTGISVDTNAPSGFSGKISLYPNPVREKATLEYELQTTEQISINLYDLQGRLIQNILPPTEKTAGKHSETILNSKGLPAGTYLLALETSSGISTIEVIF